MTRTLVFVWSQLGPYHHDRLTAVARALPDRRVVGVQIADRSGVYAWAPIGESPVYVRRTLAPGRRLEDVGRPARAAGLLRLLRAERPAAVFLCHYERPETWVAAVAARTLGARPVLMADSTARDAPRPAWREVLKRPALWPYSRALVSGERARVYLASLGMPRARIAVGYDGVDVARVRAAAGPTLTTPHADRAFVVVARFVPKKNLTAALRAYARYRETAIATGVAPRALVLVGDGPDRPALDAEIARLELHGVRFTGFLQAADTARTLARGLALLLPSTSEPWGLVVNEALALGIPPIVSERAGAAELIAEGRTGHVVSPHDDAAMAAHMARLAGEPATWHAMASAARDSAAAGDVRHFVSGVRACLPAGASG